MPQRDVDSIPHLSTACGFYSSVVSIGANNTLNKPMADNIGACKFDNANSFYTAQPVYCFNHSAFLALRQVYLCYVARYYHFGAMPHPGQDHKHLQG
jgi:hypothetical protein